MLEGWGLLVQLSTDPLSAAVCLQWQGGGGGPVLAEGVWGDTAKAQGGKSKPPASTAMVTPPLPTACLGVAGTGRD